MNHSTILKCPGCRDQIQQFQFKSHIRKCKRYEGSFLRDVSKINQYMSALEIKLMIAEVDICREKLEDVLTEKLKNPSAIMDEPLIQLPSTQDVQCRKCLKKFYSSFDTGMLFYVQECWHLFCVSCIKKYVEEEYVRKFGNFTCLSKGCKKLIHDNQIKLIVNEKKFEEMQGRAIRNMMNIVKCAKCQSQYEFVVGNARDAPKKTQSGKPLTEEHMKHYADNRFVCQKADCKSEQCKQCLAIPYHPGYTCMEFKKHAEMKKCRYCDEPLTEKNKSKTKFEALHDICNSKQCQKLAERACTKILPCGHSCCGFRNQSTCLPCLNENCCEDNEELNDQSGDDFCNICFVESLSAGPCVRSTCGHIYHEKCLQKRFEVRWLTPRIFMNFCLCPLCKKWINLPADSILANQIKRNSQLYSKIQKMSLDRLKFEQCDKDEKLKDSKSPYYKKPNEYAMAIYAYFQCYKCKNPYFGGRKSCAQAMNEPKQAGSFKAEELICPNCCEIPIQNCAKHGKDFIEFKCKFCCSISQWFCWGNTHFCEPCHKRQCTGDYVSKYTKDKLPKCPGPGKCPIGGNHGGNGDEKTLGCAICRNYKENNKNF